MAKKRSSRTPPPSQIWTAWVSSVAASIAVVISLFSLYESHETRIGAVRDEVIVHARRPMGDAVISVRRVTGNLPLGAILAPWDVLISNTGLSTVSLMGYEVLQLSGRMGAVSYTGLNDGLFLPRTGQSVSLPLTLEPGRSIHLSLVLALTPGDKAYKILLAASRGGKSTFPLYATEKLLAKKGIDLYDDPVALLGSGEKRYVWRIEDVGKEQVFLLKFHTARGIEFDDVTSWYDFKSL